MHKSTAYHTLRYHISTQGGTGPMRHSQGGQVAGEIIASIRSDARDEADSKEELLLFDD